MSKSSEVLIFQKNQEPVILEEEGSKYVAGKLTFVGLHSVSWHVDQIKKYLQNSWGYNADKVEDATIEASGVGNFLLSNEVIVILASDYTAELKPADLLEWPVELVEKAFKAAIELNPKLLGGNR